MCGIAGYVGLTSSIPEKEAKAILGRMADAIRHRGPDDGGVYADGPVGLAHRRLSIVDLSPGGHQPLSSADGSVWVSFNGEIFNYVELRRSLEARGHAFRSHSDTETIVEAYRAAGADCVK